VTEFGGRAAACRAECSTEVAMTGEAEVQSEASQVIGLRKKVQCPRQAQLQLIAIQRQPFYLLKDPG
jgi:ATP-dependent Lon protease